MTTPQSFFTFKEVLQNDASFVECVCMTNGIQAEQAKEGIAEFFTMKLATHEFKSLKNETDIRRNCLYWFPYYCKKLRANGGDKKIGRLNASDINRFLLGKD